MEKNRGYKIIILLALVFSFAGLTLGFAAMTNEEKFSQKMQQLNDEMNNFVSYLSGTTKEVNSLYATANPGKIDSTSWSGISVNITKSGGYATVGATIKNTANIADAKLSSIYTTEPFKCYKETTNEELPIDCQNINIVFTVGNSRMELNSESPSIYTPSENETIITSGATEDATLTIDYNENTKTNNGSFRVEIPTIYYSFTAKVEE